jgi:hypothetical protein
MRKVPRIILAVIVAVACALPALAQRGEGPLINQPPKGITVDQVIQQFAAKEKEFKEARDHYTYTQDVTVQTLDGNTVSGEYREVFDVTYNDQGQRLENVTYAPLSTLDRGGISMTPEDLSDIRNLLPFVLTTEEIPEYDIKYLGQQQEDELNTYVFDIHPKSIEKGKRYFDGRVWVDQQDLQIVKTYGKAVPDINQGKRGKENLFPRFTTYREQIDGHYWFPTYTRADDDLNFSTGSVHVREIVKYTNYKRFGSNVKITYQGNEVQRTNQQNQPQQSPQNPQQPQNPPQNPPQQP